MFDLDKYLADLILNCRSAFGERLLYMGLQGSRLRGEAHENSDIDVMVILDRFSVRDMDTYRGILKEIGFKNFCNLPDIVPRRFSDHYLLLLFISPHAGSRLISLRVS